MDERFKDFGRELWAILTVRDFALWEVGLGMFLVGKQLHWWLAVPIMFAWLMLRSAQR